MRSAAIILTVLLGAAATGPAQAQQRDTVVAQSRPQITVYPRRVGPGPNAVRQCRSWLAQEHRPSGTVVVPKMVCWWE